MKLRVNVAGFHKRTTLKDIGSERADMTTSEIMQKFVEQKYVGWIETNLPSADFRIEQYDANGFVIDFTYDDDAEQFRRRVGGSPISETE